MKSLSSEQKLLIRKVNQYTKEDISKSTWAVLSTSGLFAVTAIAAAAAPFIVLNIALAVLAGLLLLRLFVLYHDYMHGAILHKQKWAKPFFSVVSVFILTPKNVWRETHNYHHAHNAKITSSHIGSYRVVTKKQWQKMSKAEQSFYLFLRHPLNMLIGVFTVFILGMIVSSVARNIKKNYDGIILLVAYIAISSVVVYYFGFLTYVYALLIPQAIGGCLGAYLFYAQHNFPGVELKSNAEWTPVHAALHCSSYMEMSPIMHWFSANIGYHHIHHLNHRIPFYRLPEVMREIPELAPAHVTSWSFKDIKACFALKVWDEEKGLMVGSA
ncbi:fatty acid desaturase family protein [Glaciecola sp. 2405UD65-10]|uniref:fatty acid desaturase family protein n=1 Tax=Glaciecola sp. 2405UD65-10 TaxID=3397244 RepID=UPI003B5CC3F8